MEILTEKFGAVSFDSIALNDGGLVSLKAKISSGQISPEAPCAGMYSKWTEGQKLKLDNALSRVFDLNKCAVDSPNRNQLPVEPASGFGSVIWTAADEQRLDAALAKRAERRAKLERVG